MPSILITGASRGIGLEFVKQYARNGWSVIAAARTPAKAEKLQALAREYANIRIEELDISKKEQSHALAQRIKGVPIDVLLHNAGIAPGAAADSAFGSLNYDMGREAMDTNVWGTMALTEALIDNVLLGTQRKVIVMSSAAGSITSVAIFGGMTGGSYMYRISKAALNMAMSMMAMDLKPKGITVGLLSPGQVDTDLGGGHKGTPSQYIITAETSVAGLMPVIESFNLETTGKFIRYTGQEVPW